MSHHPDLGQTSSSYPNRALTIAGSDSGGGAGLQADLKTFTLLGVYGLSVITALTAQNTLGVQQILDIPGSFVKHQLTSVLDDIGTEAIKTGMLWSRDIVETVAGILKGKNLPLVIDPVLAAKRGEPLLQPEAIPSLKKYLFPLATLVTPNIPEVKALTGFSSLRTIQLMKEAARNMIDMGVSHVLIKGGHLFEEEPPDGRQIYDLFYDGAQYTLFEKNYLPQRHLHGVGCTLSAAITAFLARGSAVLQAVEQAQGFIQEAIRHACSLGQGIGPVNPVTRR